MNSVRVAFNFVLAALIAATAIAQETPTEAPKPKPAEQTLIDSIKKSLADSQKVLRQYEWIETTVIGHKGEEKSRVVKRCYYGEEGTLQKVLVTAPPKEKRTRGIRGMIKREKQEEMKKYMEAAEALVHKYLPASPIKVQACKAAGKASILLTDPGKRATVVLSDYLMPGDALSFTVDLVKESLLSIGVSTLLGEDNDPVTLGVGLGTFPNGTIYTAKTILDAKAKEIQVTVENSGYRKLAE
jgi:hypothetical protein